MLGFALKLFIVVIGILAVVYCAANAFRNARQLQHRLDEFREEQDTFDKRNGPRDPYAALAELYQEDENKKTKKIRTHQCPPHRYSRPA